MHQEGYTQKGAPSPCQHQASGSRRSRVFWVRGTTKGQLPVVEQEEAGRQGDSELQPPPVRDGVSDGIKKQEPNGESRLVEDPHRPPVLRADHFCHCERAQGQVSALVPLAGASRGGAGGAVLWECPGETLGFLA